MAISPKELELAKQTIQETQFLWNLGGSYEVEQKFNPIILECINSYGGTFYSLNYARISQLKGMPFSLDMDDEIWVFSKRNGRTVVDTIKKPIELKQMSEIKSKYTDCEWAYAITYLLLKEESRNIQLIEVHREAAKRKFPTEINEGDYRVSFPSIAVVAYDLKNQRLAALCIWPNLYLMKLAENVAFFSGVRGALTKIMSKFKEDLGRVFFLTPFYPTHEAEWFTWIIYSIRDKEIRERIEHHTGDLKGMQIEEFLLFGYPPKLNGKETCIFKDSSSHTTGERVSKGMNLNFLNEGKEIKVTFRTDDYPDKVPNFHIHYGLNGGEGESDILDHTEVSLDNATSYGLQACIQNLLAKRMANTQFKDSEFMSSLVRDFNSRKIVPEPNPKKYQEVIERMMSVSSICAKELKAINTEFNAEIRKKFSALSTKKQAEVAAMINTGGIEVAKLLEMPEDETELAQKLVDMTRRQNKKVLDYINETDLP